MFLQTLGSLILVACASYHLVTASWQVVLLSFVVAGVGYATWIVRKAIIRRAKIKALWRRSIEIDEMLDIVSQQHREPPAASSAPSRSRSRRSGKTPVAFQGPARSSATTGGGKLNYDSQDKSQTDSGAFPHVVREITADPSKRVYKFSMKALANSRVEKTQDQPVLV
ncbi:MAG: hypothetical protein SGJ27_29370 [Candidatus Melainabacteria bacterium]|nr:hypothetical protein [Candidatus Melainabacteria bacterium]